MYQHHYLQYRRKLTSIRPSCTCDFRPSLGRSQAILRLAKRLALDWKCEFDVVTEKEYSVPKMYIMPSTTGAQVAPMLSP